MNTSKIFSLNSKDVQKALVMAVFSGALLPVLAMIQTQGFDIFKADWHQILVLALNGGVAGFVGYLVKNFFSNSEGQIVTPLGRIG